LLRNATLMSRTGARHGMETYLDVIAMAKPMYFLGSLLLIPSSVLALSAFVASVAPQ
jgi:hypothetical protein